MVQIVTSPTTPTLELVYFVAILLRWMTVFVRAQSAESLGWLTNILNSAFLAASLQKS